MSKRKTRQMSKKGACKKMSKRERELLNERREEMRSYWSDRVLPETGKHLDLSNLTESDIGCLEMFKFTLTQCEKEGVDLTWGRKIEAEVNDE